MGMGMNPMNPGMMNPMNPGMINPMNPGMINPMNPGMMNPMMNPMMNGGMNPMMNGGMPGPGMPPQPGYGHIPLWTCLIIRTIPTTRFSTARSTVSSAAALPSPGTIWRAARICPSGTSTQWLSAGSTSPATISGRSSAATDGWSSATAAPGHGTSSGQRAPWRKARRCPGRWRQTGSETTGSWGGKLAGDCLGTCSARIICPSVDCHTIGIRSEITLKIIELGNKMLRDWTGIEGGIQGIRSNGTHWDSMYG